MKKKFSELTLEEFVRVLCNMECDYKISVTFYPHSGSDIKSYKMVGKYQELYTDCEKQLAQHPDNKKIKDAIKTLEETAFDYDIYFDTLDIYDYLAKRTEGFQEERCKILLDDMDLFHHIIDEERASYVNDEISNGWTGYKIKYIKKPEKGRLTEVFKKDIPCIDYNDAFNRLYGYGYDINYCKAVNFLRDKIDKCEKKCDKLSLPPEIDTPRSNKYFEKAITAGYLEQTHTGMKWKAIGGHGGNAQLGYFIYKIYDSPRPISALEKWFGIVKLSSHLTNADIDAKRADVINWRKEIDKLFDD